MDREKSMKNHFCHLPRKPLFLDYYLSSIKPGTISYQNNIGPSGGNAIDKRANLSMLKSFSESLDRRSPIFGYNNKKSIEAYDIVTNSLCKIKKEQFSLNNDPNSYKDTTGTAAHTVGNLAVYNSLQELFQKNALALIWYSRRVYKRKFKGFDLLVNTDFFPMYHTLILVDLDGRSCFGMGSSVNFEKAYQKAFEEALLLLYENAHAEFLFHGRNRLSYQLADEKQKSYFNSLLEDANEYLFEKSDKSKEDYWINELIPHWVRHIYVSLLPNEYNTLFKVVKLYSPDLFASLPYKTIVLEAKDKKILEFINKEELAEVPDIPNL
ncbi:YcaO-like family protein [Streptococcus mutans]|uniref:YcaO-like family protein n=2 Tax=Streptococcus mutans TaxID=1309 RepID=UPI001EE65E4B|nr:YcaO-like family protein [Streptococcus mutans]